MLRRGVKQRRGGKDWGKRGAWGEGTAGAAVEEVRAGTARGVSGGRVCNALRRARAYAHAHAHACAHACAHTHAHTPHSEQTLTPKLGTCRDECGRARPAVPCARAQRAGGRARR